MKTYLKVKAKSLAAEARIIRLEEKRTFKRITYEIRQRDPVTGELGPAEVRTKYVRKNHPLRLALRTHRVCDVRWEARATNLARGFLKNHPLGVIETIIHSRTDQLAALVRAQEIAEKYATEKKEDGTIHPVDKRVTAQRFAAWADATPSLLSGGRTAEHSPKAAKA